MALIQFHTELLQIKSWKIIRLPKNISNELPSRGMSMIDATINEVDFKIPLEPDGMGSHWFKVSEALYEEIGLKVGDILLISIKPTKEWDEPKIPEDLNNSLVLFKVQTEWNSITTKARWEWIRWIRSTSNPDTRQKRIQTACSMLECGKKKPCCFDHSRCTEPYISKNGILIADFKK
jgi:hypothetical protein